MEFDENHPDSQDSPGFRGRLSGFEIPLTISAYIAGMANSINSVLAGRAPETARPSGYQSESLREVKSRAAVSGQNQSTEERNNLRRLNSVLSHERPLREDVPRGYYLNIKV